MSPFFRLLMEGFHTWILQKASASNIQKINNEKTIMFNFFSVEYY